MQYQKKVVLLKQISQPLANEKPISAIARMEIEDGVFSLFLSVLNARVVAGGEYYTFLMDTSGSLFEFLLGARPSSASKTFEKAPDIDKGAIIGLFLVCDNIPELVALGKSQECNLDSTALKKRVAENFLRVCKAEKDKTAYDDEAVATVNYYECDEVISDVSNENDVYDFASTKETAQDNTSDYCLPNATDFIESQVDNPSTYFDKAREELEEIFLKFDHVLELEKLFPSSKFARINYSSDKYYVVGVICEDEKEKYVCYGVPGKYSENAPKELAPYCTFIPLSVFNLSGEGFWMMFQDAETGVCLSAKK